MEIFDSLDKVKDIEPTSVALGNFDGVHLGHQDLIKRTVEKGREKGLKTAVFTFSNHPREMLPDSKKVLNIMTKKEKADMIASLGIDYLFSIPFTEEIMVMSPEAFVQEILLDKFNMKEVFCGFNFNFGYKGQGNPEVLKQLGKEKGFNVTEIPPYMVDGDVVSSTLIRTLISSGEVDECPKYLGRNYTIRGEVIVGNKLGRKLGFPTSNIAIDQFMISPPNGVYVTMCDYNGVSYPSITNVGTRPTIGHFAKNVETHIFRFNKELYGKEIKVEFLKKMRDEVKFDTIKELSDQIVKDCEDAEEYHKEHGQL